MILSPAHEREHRGPDFCATVQVLLRDPAHVLDLVPLGSIEADQRDDVARHILLARSFSDSVVGSFVEDASADERLCPHHHLAA